MTNATPTVMGQKLTKKLLTNNFSQMFSLTKRKQFSLSASLTKKILVAN